MKRIAFFLFACFTSTFSFASDNQENQDTESVITGLEGEKFELDILYRGEPLRLFGAWQREMEYRIHMLERAAGETLVRDILHGFYPKLYTDKTRGFYNGKPPYIEKNLPLYLSPLGSRLEEFHDSFNHPSQGEFPVRSLNYGLHRPEDFTIEIVGHTMEHLSRPKDYISPKFIVGKRRESADYFDDSSFTLRSQKIAVRIKSWFKMGATVPSRKSVFVKISDGSESLFTLRREYHVQVPIDFSNDEVALVVDALSKKIIPELAIKLKSPLQQQKRVNTFRHGINLMWQDSPEITRKIGFVTFDDFSVIDLQSQDSYLGNYHQMEIEVLPNEVELVRGQSTRDTFTTLFSDLKMVTNGVDMPTPKYLHCGELIKKLGIGNLPEYENAVRL